MNKRDVFKKTVAWAMIVAAINPAMIAPAFSRDSDIYLATTSGNATAEPNVLFILGTNDRMNVAEAWREYPGAYDSHAEYLWNDINVISTSEVTTEEANAISDASPPVNPFSPWGTWSGALASDRQALWQATKTYAQATQTGDPGPRSTYRNYWGGYWYYWLPAGTATSDPRLWSVSFNRFIGFVQGVAGSRGGVTFPPGTANYGDTSDYRVYNLCTSSTTQLEPSTILSPTGRAQNAGYVLNQRWVRWESYAGLQARNNPLVNYPGNNSWTNAGVDNTSSAPSVTTFYRGYVDGVSGAPTNTVATQPTNVYRDSWGSNIGSQGLPIRIQQGTVTSPTTVPNATTSYAGWTDPKADLGGFVYWYWTAYPDGYYYPQSVLQDLRTTAYNSTYALGDAGAVQVPPGSLAYEEFAAWIGNRDSAPVFGKTVGLAGYYDTTVASCSPTAGPAVGNQCIAYTSGIKTAQMTRSCRPGGSQQAEKDASDTTRFVNGTCNNQGGGSCVFDQSGNNCAGLTAPTCTPLLQPTFYTKYYAADCAWSGQTAISVAPCAWSGRTSVYIEGQGTYYYGGSCTEGGVGTSSSAPTANSSCQVGGGSWVASKVLNGTTQSDVIGPFASPVSGGQQAEGCGNRIGSGTYSYGGTCGGGLEYTVSNTGNTSNSANPPSRRTQVVPTQCSAPSGGASLSIRGAVTRTYNQACSNSAANVDQTCVGRYGAGNCQIANAASTYCPPSQSQDYVVSAGAASYYQAYQTQATENFFYHECLADGPTQNPNGNSYPTAYMRTFGTPANFSTTASATTSLVESYTTNAAHGVAADASKNIDVYSNNYMNWLYGAKACRDVSGNLVAASPIPATATCTPIARKTRLQVAKDALAGLVSTTGGVRLGLMVYNKTDTLTNDEGGNIVYAIRRMGADASDVPAYNNRAALINAIQSVTASSRTPLTETMYEAYRYFSGRTPKWGTSTTVAQVGGLVSAARETSVGANVDPPDVATNVRLTLTAAGAYNSPMLNNPNVAAPANCQKNYIVMITNGQPEEDFSANADIKTMSWLSPTGDTISPRTDLDSHGAAPNNAGAPDFRQIPAISGGNPYGPTDAAGTINDGGYIWLDELTYFMANSDVSPGAQNMAGDPGSADLITGRQSIVTYTIGFAGVSAPVVQNAAVAASGIYYIAQNALQLQSALVSAFVAIRNWNPTAAAATVPVSSLNRGESSTDVFLAFFGPSPQSTWPGTVKKYQISNLASDCGASIQLCLTGQTVLGNGLKNIETIDPITGQSAVDSSVVSGANSDGTGWQPTTVQDGALPNKGGSGYVLLNTAAYTPDTRNVYTYLSGGVSTSTDLTNAANKMHFSNAAITKTLLGNAAMTNAVQETLINFARGGNLGDANCSDGSAGTACTTWSTWPHFATEHSKPAVVTYDTTASPPVQYLYYVQTNGMLTAVDTYTGKEKWSFMIEEALPQLSTLQANVNGPEVYVADASPAVFFDDQNGDGIVNGADRVWLYFGLRRGGRVYYALDITNKDVPRFKWKIDANSGTAKVCTGTAACATRPVFDELGQTWSTPAIVNLRKFGTATNYNPALIFGGGYDPAEDTVPPSARSMGRALYVVNGSDASVVQAWGVGSGKSGSYRTANTIATYAIPSDVAALNTDFDAQNLIDRVYVGDMGGNVWRFDIDDANEANWRAELLASLSNATGEKRKFFFPPAVAPQSQPFAFPIDTVYIGSGDKEHPTLTSNTTPATTDDRIFMLMDDPSLNSGGGTPDVGGKSALTTPITLSTLVDITDNSVAGAANIGANPVALIGKQGWMRRLDNGEKVISNATVFFGRLRFGTYAPLTQLNACTPPGEGRANEIDSLTGSLFQLNTGLAMSPSQRWFSGFLSRGYMSSTQLLVLRVGTTRVVYTFTCADANCAGQNVLTIGAPTKVYWYMEPEQ